MEEQERDKLEPGPGELRLLVLLTQSRTQIDQRQLGLIGEKKMNSSNKEVGGEELEPPGP